ncbi:sporulation stage III protein AG [Tissierellaceae bacterium HCP3S3_D8]
MNDLINRIKKYLEDTNNRKTINNLFIILIVAIILLIFLNGMTSSKKKDDSSVIKEGKKEYTNVAESDYSIILENKLSNILSKLKGVGEVHVMITLEDSQEKVPATNKNKMTETTSETDSEGGKREITREDEVTQLINLSNDVIILKEINPNIKGVIVVAEGADNGVVLETIYEAVKTVLGVSANKVQVFSSK